MSTYIPGFQTYWPVSQQLVQYQPAVPALLLYVPAGARTRARLPTWHTADHCIISLTQHATIDVSQSGAARERDRWADMWLPLPSGLTQPGQRKSHLRAGVKCVSSTSLPSDVYEDRWPCCEGTTPIPSTYTQLQKKGFVPVWLFQLAKPRD